jgi:CHAD domain-containing protein
MNSSLKKVLNSIVTEFQETQDLILRIQSQKKVNSNDLHAFRIGLRKIEASLRIVHRVNRKLPPNPALIQIRNLLKNTGAARNEEALVELIRKRKGHPEIQDWVKTRSTVLTKLESKLPLIIAKDSSKNLSEVAKVSLITPLAGMSCSKFTKKAKFMIKEDCQKLIKMTSKLNQNKNNMKYLHGFRIQAKKLRYVLEQLEPLLGHHSKKIKSLVEKNQGSFGRLHDLDSALILAKSHSKVSESLLADRKRTLKHALHKGRELRRAL